MPHGDTCVSHLFEPGAIPASAGMTPILPTTAEPPSGQATVAVAIIEAAAATDAATGIKITAIGVMTETATAASVVNAGLTYSVAIVEAAIAAATIDAGGSYGVSIAEAATVVSAEDAVLPVWSTTYSKTITSNSIGWSGFNMRQVIDPAELAVSGSKVRVTLKAGLTTGLVIDHAAIGHAALSGDPYDFNGGQIALTFSGGSAGCTIAANGSIRSDEMTFTLDKTKSFIVAVHFSGTSSTLSASTSAASHGYYKSAADEVLVSNVSTYTAGLTYLVSLIEVL